MSNIWNKIHRIKDNGWTWQQFLEAIDKEFPAGIDEKTLYQLHRRPDRTCSRHVAHIINTIHEQRFPSPFPAEIDGLLQLYNNLVKLNKHGEHTLDIERLEIYLKKQTLEEKPGLGKARLFWLLGNIHFDRLPLLRDNGQHKALAEQKQYAINSYSKALDEIASESGHEQLMLFIPYKLQQNILACHLNAVYENKRERDPELLAWLEKSSFLQDSKSLLEQEPFNWLVARNALRFSSILNNASYCEFFFQALVKSSKHFLDPAFEPLNYSSLLESKNFAWALEHVIKPYLEKNRTESLTR